MDLSSNFRIPLHKKITKIRLPPLRVWNSVVGKSQSIRKGYAEVMMVDFNRFFGCKYMADSLCIVNKKGYLVVYKDLDDLTGYAFDLTSAMKLSVTEKFDSYGVVRKTRVEIKWGFGAIILRFNYEPHMGDIFYEASRSSSTQGVFNEEYCNREEGDSTDDEEASTDDDDEESTNEEEATRITVTVQTSVSTTEVTTSVVSAKSQSLQFLDPLVQARVNGETIEIYFQMSEDQVNALRSLLAQSDGVSMQLCFNDSSQCNSESAGGDDGSAM